MTIFDSKPSTKWECNERLTLIGMLVWRLQTRAGLLDDRNVVEDTLDKIALLSNKPSDWLEDNRTQFMEGL